MFYWTKATQHGLETALLAQENANLPFDQNNDDDDDLDDEDGDVEGIESPTECQIITKSVMKISFVRSLWDFGFL